MSIEDRIPVFAVIGAVNHGKSSVVSTLMEDDSVSVSPIPGETADVRKFRLADLLVFCDTPGFQNARKVLVEIRRAPENTVPLTKFKDFTEKYSDDFQYEAECRLLKPVLAGAGIIYVVDGSLPVTELHRCEMELIRLTGVPRLAIINRIGNEDFINDWRSELEQTMNAVREFNAHSASFEDRKDLLEALANIKREWKPSLQAVIAALLNERESRIADTSALTVRLVRDCLTYSESKQIPLNSESADARKAVEDMLQDQFRVRVSKIETRMHAEIIKLFEHRLVKAEHSTTNLFKDTLFSDETWSLMGLNERQLVATGVALGALVGASTDLLTLGHTFMLGTLSGATIGGASAYFVGKKQPNISFDMPGRSNVPKVFRWALPEKLTLSNCEIVVGPIKAINFPWILLDRVICTLSYVAGRAHGRRDESNIQVDKLMPSLALSKLTTEHWPEADRKRCDKLLVTLRKNSSLSTEENLELTGIIGRHLRAVVEGAEKSMHSVTAARPQL